MTSRAVDRWKHGQSREHEYWHRALYNDPYFMVLLCDRWAEIQGNLDGIIAELDAVSEEIRVEAELNYEFWQYTKKQKNQVEVDDLRKWLTDRINWMSEQMTDPHTLLKSFGYYQSSRAFTIADTKDTGDYLELTVTVQNAQRVKACDVVLNGRIILSEELTGKNVLRIDKSLLRESGETNAIEILGKNAAGNYSIALQSSGSGGTSQAESQCLFYVTP